MLIWPGGTPATIKISKQPAIITAAVIRFEAVAYELRYYYNGKQEEIWANECEFTVKEGYEKIEIGFHKTDVPSPEVPKHINYLLEEWGKHEARWKNNPLQIFSKEESKPSIGGQTFKIRIDKKWLGTKMKDLIIIEISIEDE